MKRKNLISLTIAFAFTALAITGILLYVKQKAHFIEITHTLTGLLFVGFAVFHIVNNWSSITGYSKDKKSGGIKKELFVAAAIAGIVIIGGLTEVLEPVAEFGRIFKEKPKGEKPEIVNFEEIASNIEASGADFTLIVQQNKEAHEAQIAIWVEDSTHQFVENILVAKDTQVADYKNNATPNYDKPLPKDSFILHSKSKAKAPFFVKLAIQKEATNELYEAKVIATKGAVVLSSENGKLVKSGVLAF